jgi:hypothetical protein
MSILEELRIHIAPVGFEVDRIVLPAKKMRADRVWLLKHTHTDEKGNFFITQIVKNVENNNIEIKKTQADRTDLFDTLRAFHQVILEEKSNSIFVNVSVGSKIQAIASMMACMMFRDVVTIKPYYVVPKDYTIMPQKRQETVGMNEIIPLPDYKIEMPSKKLVKCLQLIDDHEDGKVSKKRLKDIAIQNKLIHERSKEDSVKGEYTEQAGFMALNKTLIEPLRSWGYITVEKVGSHNVVSLTNEVRDALRFLSV